MARPPTVAEVVPPPTVAEPPPLARTVYWLMAQPRASAGPHVTVADWSPRVACTPLGAVGAPQGVTGVDEPENGPHPARLYAWTWNDCAWPLGRLGQR